MVVAPPRWVAFAERSNGMTLFERKSRFQCNACGIKSEEVYSTVAATGGEWSVLIYNETISPQPIVDICPSCTIKVKALLYHICVESGYVQKALYNLDRSTYQKGSYLMADATKDQLLQVLIGWLPYPDKIRELDAFSKPDCIEFKWFGNHYRVDLACAVETIKPAGSTAPEVAILMHWILLKGLIALYSERTAKEVMNVA